MNSKIKNYIRTWENRCYSGGIPDEVPTEIFEKAPSYKAIAIAILKNDYTLIGVERPVSKWYSAFKKIEIEARVGYKKPIQLTLF